MNRMDRKNNSRSSKGNKKVKIKGLFIILPLVSILIGFLGVRFLLIPRFESVYEERAKKIEEFNIEKEKKQQYEENNDTELPEDPEVNQIEDSGNQVEDTQGIKTDSPSESDNKKTDESTSESKRNITLDTITIQFIQTASFSEMENAIRMKEEMNKKGYPVLIFDGQKKKTYGGGFESREKALIYLETVKKDYSDAYINSHSISPDLSTTSLSDDQISKVKENIEAIQKEIASIDSNIDDSGDYKSSSKSIRNGMIEKATEIENKFNNIEKICNGIEVDKKFTAYQNECMEILRDVQKLDENSWLKIWECYMDLKFVYNKLT